MDCKFLSLSLHPVVPLQSNFSWKSRIALTLIAHSNKKAHYRKKLPKNLRSPRRSKLPPDFGVNLFLKKPTIGGNPWQKDPTLDDNYLSEEEEEEGSEQEEEKEEHNGDIVWEADEIEAISSLFQGRIPQKPGKLNRERPLPLSLPYKLRPPGHPTPKRHIKDVSPWVVSSRDTVCKRVYKNPIFLVSLAKEIKRLNPEYDVSVVLDDCARFLRKGSLSLTIRELGHMSLPERALQTFCWAQKQPHLFPDDRILASTVEVLARNQDLKFPFDFQKFTSLASRGVIEAMIRGFIRGGSLKLALNLLSVATQDKRMLDPNIYAKLILELGKNPDKHMLVEQLLYELGERENLNLSHQDCTAMMKACVRLKKFELANGLFHWFKLSGREPSVVMYTTLIHSYYSEKEFRQALTVVWEMEGSNCLFDLPAYRVVIKLFVSLNDLSRAVRYFSKLKEAGFSPTYDIYRDLITVYMVSGRLAKCKEIWNEAEIAGFKLDEKMKSELPQLERETSRVGVGEEKPVELFDREEES
ncbi:pentatricopeptide repeat-containing protein At2g01860 isoform X1 [Manihot esculenta]|uniref:pentatricopeptide repeat-containing protein At2g01860 isoform X1 n=1 Tax=Manihot esculenta TaxID=3983 RepID=UPI000B5D52A6|nr:pentatricopeptide repeat-containing protein At2g01860 isoform X1 [Manihot esculenta]XP_043812276.1 pentatricopeptide repeat-containing protein At2g01860 isoform X1 [Manihot esculenta]XP_043812277.1 pentatricopeptide repeat-containing protein At2g01860 isoform X1 [Manihot esculenta]XP_043812278.1 pentatricopeptide repeat-containing protein At2g01860 isoform X1 [Manihot esculenta]